MASQVRNGKLVVGGLRGDIFMVDLTTKQTTVIAAPTADGDLCWDPSKNALCYNPDTGDWVFGSRDACIEPVATLGGGQLARRQTVLLKPPYCQFVGPDAFSITGMSYFPSGAGKSTYMTYGAGCSNASVGNFKPTSGAGIVAKGSKSFSFTLDGAPVNSVGVLLLGATRIRQSIGSCTLFTTPDIVITLATKPSDPARARHGTYQATIGPLALPNDIIRINTQWALAWVNAQQQPDLILSDARQLITQ